MSVQYTVENDIGYITFDAQDAKVNLLTAEILNSLDSILDQVKENAAVKAVVIQSRKKNIFIAGADIKEIESIEVADEGAAKATAGQDVLNKLEDLSLPTIAVIDGVALGGGCELALACRYRVATFNDRVRIGLPEVNLGFVPGFGGTYRLPRLVGLSQGLTMILTGKPVNAQKALRIGLVDRLIPQVGLEQHLRVFLDAVLEGVMPFGSSRKRRVPGLAGHLERFKWGHKLIFKKSGKSVMAASKGFYPAPERAVTLIQETFYADRVRGLALESAAFGELAVTDISNNLVFLFYLSEQFKKLSFPGAEDVQALSVRKCGVLGAGVMGGGSAQLLSHKGLWVRIKDLEYPAVAQGLRAAAKLFNQAVKKRRLKRAQAQTEMARISGTVDYSGFSQCDVVIEAVVEHMDVKKSVFKELNDVVPAPAVLATNTSALSVTEMAAQVDDPSRVIGFHFFNPVHRMPLVEVITTESTSPQTVKTALSLCRTLGKTPILVKDSCGFVVNRILLAYIAEAGRILSDYGDMEVIDKAMTDFGMPMGPFLLADEVGLDVGVKVMTILEQTFGERYAPAEIFGKILEAGLLGKKSGKGFYLHTRKNREPNPQVKDNLPEPKDVFHSGECLDRLVLVMINEAAACLQDGIVDGPGAIDVGMVFGTGFPPFRGGLLKYADQIGLKLVVQKLENLKSQLNAPYFTPNPFLKELAASDQGFYTKSHN